jgi:hypothetical protein
MSATVGDIAAVLRLSERSTRKVIQRFYPDIQIYANAPFEPIPDDVLANLAFRTPDREIRTQLASLIADDGTSLTGARQKLAARKLATRSAP